VWSYVSTGGNITGKVLSVSAPTFFSQTWRAPTWPEGHYGTLKASIEQGSNTTKLSLDLEGVPVGKEEETEKGLEIYYIRSLKVGLTETMPTLWDCVAD
jgi:activator of HSP90 ATPase